MTNKLYHRALHIGTSHARALNELGVGKNGIKTDIFEVVITVSETWCKLQFRLLLANTRKLASGLSKF